MKMIACYNNKGGVGKSTIVLNVAYSLAKQGKRVLVMDCDGQQNAARFLCDKLPDADHGLERLLLASPAISPTAIKIISRYDMIDVITHGFRWNGKATQHRPSLRSRGHRLCA